jgi:dihydrofolate reductase
MRRTISSTFVSLDGVMNHMEHWHFDYVDDESGAVALDQLRSSDALLMGRETYESYATTWPRVQGEYADNINAIAKYVASTTLKDPEWANTTVLEGDLAEAVADLKRQPGQDILMHGYGPVAKTLMRHGLLDRLILWVHPALAGVGTTGDMVFSEGITTKLTLLDVKTLQSGVVVLGYATAAP